MKDTFSEHPKRTSKTDETYTLDNVEFLKSLFGELKRDIRPIVVSFHGNPENVPKKYWLGKAWEPDGIIVSVQRTTPNKWFWCVRSFVS